MVEKTWLQEHSDGLPGRKKTQYILSLHSKLGGVRNKLTNPFSGDVFPQANFHLLEVSCPPQTVSPTGEQLFNEPIGDIFHINHSISHIIQHINSV